MNITFGLCYERNSSTARSTKLLLYEMYKTCDEILHVSTCSAVYWSNYVLKVRISISTLLGINFSLDLIIYFDR